MFRIAVLASTHGTDLQAIIDAIKDGALSETEIACVVSNKSHCFALKRAANQGLKTYFINPKGKIREEFDDEISEILTHEKVDLVVLVGYMRILSQQFVEKFRNRIINVHPSLIPAFCGPKSFNHNVHEEVLRRGVKVTGCTIHFVTEDCDAGPIILQKTVAVADTDTPETLKKKVQNLEKKYYPEVINWIRQGKVEIQGNKTMLKTNRH